MLTSQEIAFINRNAPYMQGPLLDKLKSAPKWMKIAGAVLAAPLAPSLVTTAATVAPAAVAVPVTAAATILPAAPLTTTALPIWAAARKIKQIKKEKEKEKDIPGDWASPPNGKKPETSPEEEQKKATGAIVLSALATLPFLLR
jgi:hypothetical protein